MSRRLAQHGDAPVGLRNVAITIIGEHHHVESARELHVLEEAFNQGGGGLVLAKHPACDVER